VSQKTVKNVLREFGLTSKEAEVYIFLAKYEVLTGGEIAKQTKIARSLVYRILKSLQSKALVEATLESPTRFVAVPFEKALDLIIKTKQEEALMVERARKDLLKDWRIINKAKPKLKYEKFVVIEESKKIYSKILQMIKETKNQFSGILPVSSLVRAEQFGVFDAAYNHPLKSKIKFQFVTDLTVQNLKAMKLLKPKLKVELNLKGRKSEVEVTSFPRVLIRDYEEVLFFIRPEGETTTRKQGEVCIYTNCESLVQTFNGIFQDLWHNSTDIEDRIVEIDTGKLPKTVPIKSEKITKTVKEYKYPLIISGEEAVEPKHLQRIRFLTEEERDILDCASVIGEEFSSDIIEKVAGFSRIRILKKLNNIERKHQLIHSKGDEYRFDHPKIGELLYNEISPKLRKEYHSLIAKYLEEANKACLKAVENELAYHYYNSNNAMKAVPFLLKSGRDALKEFVVFDALRYFSQALEMMGNKEGWTEQRIETLENLGDSYALTGQHDKANQFYEKGMTTSDKKTVINRMRKKMSRKVTIEKNGVKINYYVYGEGKSTIVYVGHLFHFMPQIHYFSQKHKIVAMDLAEIWEPTNLPKEYTIDLYIDSLKAIIEDQKTRRIYLMGIAFGGTLSIKYVTEFPKKVSKLALLASPTRPAFGGSNAEKKQLNEFWVTAFQNPSWGAKKRREQLMKVLEYAWSSYRVKDKQILQFYRDKRVLQFFKMQEKLPPEIQLICDRLLWETDVRPLLSKIKIPTLILHGEKDIIPLKAVENMSKRISGSKLHIFKGAQVVSLLESEKFNQVLEEFFFRND
jgi:sugar-specific transcriptional regulator TrmB/pimeloyl-ACP methyl ester carboxylesterase